MDKRLFSNFICLMSDTILCSFSQCRSCFVDKCDKTVFSCAFFCSNESGFAAYYECFNVPFVSSKKIHGLKKKIDHISEEYKRYRLFLEQEKDSRKKCGLIVIEPMG